MHNTLNRQAVFEGIRQICDAEMSELHAASLNTAHAICDMMDDAEKQVLSCARRTAGELAERSDGVSRKARVNDSLVRAIVECGRQQAVKIQQEVEKRLNTEAQRLVLLAMTVDRLIEHLSLDSKTTGTTGSLQAMSTSQPGEKTLLERLAHFRLTLSLYEKKLDSLDGAGPASAFGAGAVAAASGMFSACHFLLTDFERAQDTVGVEALREVGDRMKHVMQQSGAERRRGLECYVHCRFRDLEEEVYAVLTGAQGALDELDGPERNLGARLLSGGRFGAEAE